MKKLYKKLIALGMAALMCVPMTACGGKNEATSAQTKEYVYVPEYKELSEQSGDLSNVIISNNMIYYMVWSYDETTGASSTAVKSLEVGSTESKTLPIQLDENDSVNDICADSDGNLIMVISTYSEGENPEDYTQAFCIKKFSPDGNELFTVDLSQILGEADNAYIQYVVTDGDGNIYLSNGDTKIWVLDTQGNKLCDIDVANYISAMGPTKEGKVVISTYGTDASVLQEIDLASKSLGTTYENVPSQNGSFKIVKGSDKGCLISSGNSLYEYDFETQASEELLNWIDSDINCDMVDAVAALDDGRIFALINDYNDENATTEMVYLTKTPSSEVTQKTIVTYGTLYMSSRVRSEIINFNKTNETYRIQPKEYGTDDYQTGMAQMNSDIVSGNSPDIIDLSMGNTSQFVQKGVLEDLYPYIDKDSELNKDDYVESVFKAYETDGKLYALLPTFSISTIIGKTSEVGDKMGWTLDQLMSYVNSKPEGTEVFQYATKDSIMTILCMFGMDQFVDWDTGKCSFNGDSFIKLLEFANTFDSEFNFDENEPSEASKIQSGQMLLSMGDISDVSSYQMYEAMFGEPITCIGYPTDSGTGSAITPGELTLGISSKSSNKDGAWEFVRKFITSDYQTKSQSWGFPILKSALQANFDEAMKPTYYEDENGNQVEQSKNSWGYADADMEVYAATQEQVDDVMNLINSADATYQYDEEMYSIIQEESAAFFKGQKTAKDVADVIQSRIQIYVNENR